ncbi:hypothetical protein DL95DRAFT_414415 [Leptodontidium sp. 2 PMI_412]|nr:hypothetical protein DL95DRAFT_414415 [Leptodontidium sp. 2 PMI_412]
MEYETSFDYAGDPLNSNSYLEYGILTPSTFDASDYDFSNMLNFNPPAGESQMNMLNLQTNPQLARAEMPGGYVSDSEYFPTFPASTSPFASTVASTIVPAALSMTTSSDLPADGILQFVPLQDSSEPRSLAAQPFDNNNLPVRELPQLVPLQAQIEPQLDTLAALPDADRQQCEAETTHLAGQKSAKPTTCCPGAGKVPKLKRRRGTRKKVRTEEELAIRRENHLQRNKDAAQKCRQKKKVMEAEKKKQMVMERQNNHIVWNQVTSVQDELDSFRFFALDIECHCHSDDHKIAAKTGLETIMKTAAKLQDQINMCNQRRAQISQGLVMQRSVGGYVQQDSMQNGPGSTHDSQSPAMSPQNSTGLSEQMPSPRSTRGSSYATRQLNTDFANGNRITRKVSNDSSTQPDSAVDFNSPPGAKKDSPVEDEAIEKPVHEKEEFLPLRTSMGNNADPMFALLAHMERTGPGRVN